MQRRTFLQSALAARVLRAADKFDLAAIERPRVLRAATGYLTAPPVTVTAASSPRSSGGPHDFFSEGDYEGWIVRIPASDIKMLKMDQAIAGDDYFAFRVAGSSISGAGVDRSQNVWSVATSGSVTTRALVDVKGNVTAPDIQSGPMAKNVCPAGDRCELKDNNASEPGPYTYSDFTGFGLRNFTRPKGTYSYIFQGCHDANNVPQDTHWFAIDYDADVPPNTSLTVHARTGIPAHPDDTWGMWTDNYAASPANLQDANNALKPNQININDMNVGDYYLQVEFTFTTMEKNATPKLKSFSVGYKCEHIG